MQNYDFKSLSSYDFECLVRDLLQEELKITLESFKYGRDNGIHLRYSLTEDETMIVQCKHYAVTGCSGLISNLKQEIEKVKKLNPKKYIIVTSVGLVISFLIIYLESRILKYYRLHLYKLGKKILSIPKLF